MLRLALRNVVANKARLALVTLAVTIGVSFVSSTFIFSDSLVQTFDDLTAEITAGVDLEVRPTGEFGTDGALTNDAYQRIAATEGVTAAGAHLETDTVVPITPNGELAEGYTISFAWVDNATLNGFDLIEGTAPEAGDFVVSEFTAQRDGFVVGDSYQLTTPVGTVERSLSGTIKFHGTDAFDEQLNFLMVPLDDAQTVFGNQANDLDFVTVMVDANTSAAVVQERIGADLAASELDTAIEVVSQRTIQDEAQADFNSQLSILRNTLLGFAIVSLFVSTFIIKNTFGIILKQRVQEIGLLRAIGADSRQIGRSVLGEAIVVGLVASVFGIAAGLGLNYALVALFNAIGAGLPEFDAIIATRTVILAFAVGVGVTLLSAFGPARRAGRVPPVTAMRGLDDTQRSATKRIIAGAVFVLAGAGSFVFGLFGASGTELVLTTMGLGVAAIFVGITLASPVLAGPIVAIIGSPLAKFGGVAGRLSQENARRNPQRTANSAGALMIGLALITTVLVIGQSFKTHLAATLDNSVSADFVVSNDFEPMSAVVADEMNNLDAIGPVLPVSEEAIKIGDDVREADVLPFDAFANLFDVGVTAGAVPAGGTPAAMLAEPVATELGLQLGDQFDVEFANGVTQNFVVEALYTDTTLIEAGVLLDRAIVDAAMPLPTVDWVAVGVAAGSNTAEATAALDAFATEWPQIAVQTATDYRESIEEQIDQLLGIVNVMLALSIVIALIGIGLTLALSIFERTREIGLLRAVGMSRRQLRRMVRWEAALIALFGAVLGVGTGLAYGWGVVKALPDNVTSVLSIPVTNLAVLIVASALAGLIAAMLPARRAGRLNVLDAITGRTA